MRLLLDTHTLLWLIDGSPSLSAAAQAALMDPANDLIVSVVTIWELAIKTTKQNGPLVLNEPLDAYLSRWLPVYQLSVLPIQQAHALFVLGLPNHHKDPFDRMLIAQAISEGMPLVSADAKFAAYAIPIIW